MAEPIRKTIDAAQKVFEVKPRTFDAWDQRGLQTGDKPVAKPTRRRTTDDLRTPGLTREGALAEALREPFSKVGNKEYTTDVAAILRNYVFSEDPYHRYVAQQQYQALSPSQRQQVDALIVAANPNPRSAQGVSPTAAELLHVLTGKRLSPERERAIADAAKFEGYSADQQARDAAFSRPAPPDAKPAVERKPNMEGERPIKSLPEDRPKFRGPSAEMVNVAKGPLNAAKGGLDAPAMTPEQRQILRQAFPAYYEGLREKFRRALQAETVDRAGDVRQRKPLPEIQGNTPEEIRAWLIARRDEQRSKLMADTIADTLDLEGKPDSEIIEQLAISPEEWPGLERYRLQKVNQKYPDYRSRPDLLEQDTDRAYQIKTFSQSPEGVEQAVDRRYPPLSSMTQEQIDAKIDAGWQSTHERSNYGRIQTSDRSQWSLTTDDSAALDAAEKQARGEPLTEGERRAVSGYDPNTNMTRRDRGEMPPSQTYAEKFREVLGYDPWITPEEFNSARSLGRPGKKPDNIPGVAQNRTRRPTAEDSIGDDDSAAFDDRWDDTAELAMGGVEEGSGRAQREQANLADRMAKGESLEEGPLKGKKSRGASKGSLESMTKRSMDVLYQQILRSTGIKDGAAMAEATVRPPSYHGFKSPEDMADYAVRLLEKDKPIPPLILEKVRSEMAGRFADRWGSDLGLDELASGQGRRAEAAAQRTQDLRDRLAGRPVAAKVELPPGPSSVPGGDIRQGTTQDPGVLPPVMGRWPQGTMNQTANAPPWQGQNAWDIPEPIERNTPDFSEGPDNTADVTSFPSRPPLADDGIFGSEDFASEDMGDFVRSVMSGDAGRPKPTQVGQPDADVVQPTAAGKQPVTDGRDPNDALLETEEAPAIPTSEELSSATMRGRLERKPQAPASPQPQAAGKPPAGRPPVQPRAAAAGGNDPLAQYIKDAAKNAQILATEKEGLPKFAGAMAYYNDARQQLQALMSDPKAKPIADRLAAEVIGPMDAAIKKRFPKGAPSHLSPSATPAPSAKPAAQAAPKGVPNTPAPGAERTPASFAADVAAGKQLTSPEDIQFYKNNAAEIEAELKKLSQAGPTQNGGSTPSTGSSPSPSKPIDPLDSASKTEVGEEEGLALPNPNAGAAVTPPPVPATRPTPLKDLQQEYARLNRGIREFRARTGRSPTQAEIEDIRQALASGGEIGSPIQDFSVSPEDFKEGNFGQYMRNRLAGMRGAQDEANRRVADARALDEARTGKFFGDSGEDLEELPVPGARAAAESEQAARNVDAAKATKDAESDKATAVSAKAASDADAEAAAKRTEDAANTNTAPQPQKAGQSGKQPSEPGFLGREFNRFKQQGSLYPITAGVRAVVGTVGQGAKWGPLAALGGYGLYSARDYIKQALPEDYHDEVDAGARLLEQAGGAAANIAGRMFGGQGEGGLPGGGSGPGGSAPGGQGPEIMPVSMPGEGPIQGEEGINMVPQGLPPGYQTQDSLDRIRRIISATQPQSRHQPGTAQRPTAY